MNIFAYCCASFRNSVYRASGVEPLLCPPVDVNTFVPDLLMGRDLVYLKLHGLPNQPYWYGDNWTTALNVSAFKHIALKGTVVFIANCHLVESPFLAALVKTGATVIGGPGENYAQAHGIIGADLLGYALRKALETRISPANALRTAKTVLKSHTAVMQSRAKRVKAEHRFDLEERIRANLDTLAFSLFSQDS